MEVARPPGLLPRALADLVTDHFPFRSVDVSTIRELKSYGDRNYYFRGDLMINGPGSGLDELETAYSEHVLKVLNWREPRVPGLVDGLAGVMFHLRDKGYQCCYPVSTTTPKENGVFSVQVTEQALQGYNARRTRNDVERGLGEQNVFDVLVLVYVQGEPLSRMMKTTPTEKLLYSMGQYVGEIDNALQDFQNQALKDRMYQWDLKHLPDCRKYLHVISNKEKKQMAEAVLDAFDKHVLSQMADLQHGVIHNDPTETNILVEERNGSLVIKGIIDFGDCVHSCYIFELGNMLVHTMLSKDNPVEYVTPILAGYLSSFEVTQQEFDILYYVLLGRLVQLILHGEHNCVLEPDNKHLLTSLNQEWMLMSVLLPLGKEYVNKKWLPLMLKTQ